MPIKRFNEAEKPEPKPEVGQSMFTPFKPVEDARKTALGDRVYSAREDTQEALAEAEATLRRVMGDVERSQPIIQELLQLHMRMSAMPTGPTVKAFLTKIDEVVGNQEDNRAVLTMAISFIAYLQNHMGK